LSSTKKPKRTAGTTPPKTKEQDVEIRKLEFNEETKENRRHYATKETVAAMQVIVYVMCGGSLLGRFAAEQPKDFYIDDRCSRLPYPKRAIYQAVKALVQEAECVGIDPRNMPRIPDFHNCGVF